MQVHITKNIYTLFKVKYSCKEFGRDYLSISSRERLKKFGKNVDTKSADESAAKASASAKAVVEKAKATAQEKLNNKKTFHCFARLLTGTLRTSFGFD